MSVVGLEEEPVSVIQSPITIVESQSQGTTRRLSIIGKAPTAFSAGQAATESRVSREYPYCAIQLEVDQQGKGQGFLYVYASLAFNQQGQMVLRPSGSPIKLMKVRLEK